MNLSRKPLPMWPLWPMWLLWSLLAIVLAALLLAACGSWEFPEETGAPPRPMPPGMVVKVYPIADKTLQGTTTAAAYAKEGGRLPGRTWVSLGGTECAIEITDAPMPAAEYERILTHEKRHCTGQQHELKRINGKPVLVWLP
jgi:hypothetical protein